MSNTPSLATNCPINVERLIESKLLAQANSGAGKSWLIRRIAEQTYGAVQQIIIDHDGEYHTLAEQFDYVIARKGGDVPVDIKSAALLARRLLELGVSAIIDIYELGIQRAEFVKRFLDALTNSPRELWHPCLVVIDEAHLYAPEKGSAVSAHAVKEFMSLGRKRGFSGILATQRIAKLDKDAAAECNSKLIGRSALDVDMKRAADELGFTAKDDVRSLRTLKPGQFYAFGPAFTDEVQLVEVGGVRTTHLRAGQRSMAPPAPRDKVKKILAQLKDLPQEAEQEARTVSELQSQVRQLKTELTKAKLVQPTTAVKLVEKPILTAEQLKHLNTAMTRVDALAAKFSGVSTTFTELLTAFCDAANGLKGTASLLSVAVGTARDVVNPPTAPKPITSPVKSASRKSTSVIASTTPSSNNVKIADGEAAILRAAIQFHAGVQKAHLAVLTGYKRSTRNAYIQRLCTKGLVVDQGTKILATFEGLAALPDVTPLPTGDALRDYWYRELPVGERQILELLVTAYPHSLARSVIDDSTNFKVSTRNAYIQRLLARELITEESAAEIRASDVLF